MKAWLAEHRGVLIGRGRGVPRGLSGTVLETLKTLHSRSAETRPVLILRYSMGGILHSESWCGCGYEVEGRSLRFKAWLAEH